MTVHRYMGETILDCERVRGEHPGRWVVLTYHHSGNPWQDQLNPHFSTLPEAREYIRVKAGRPNPRDSEGDWLTR